MKFQDTLAIESDKNKFLIYIEYIDLQIIKQHVVGLLTHYSHI